MIPVVPSMGCLPLKFGSANSVWYWNLPAILWELEGFDVLNEHVMLDFLIVSVFWFETFTLDWQNATENDEAGEAWTLPLRKRSMGTGYSGVDNPLFYLNNVKMLFGDAKQSMDSISTCLEVGLI